MNRRENDHTPDQQYIKNTDSTALVVAIVAGLLGLHSDHKPYDGLSLILGVTLVTTTIAYIRGHFRKRMQSLAVALTIGFISLPLFGYVFEVIVRLPFMNLNCMENISCVPEWFHIVWWLGIANLAYSYDRRKNRRRTDN